MFQKSSHLTCMWGSRHFCKTKFNFWFVASNLLAFVICLGFMESRPVFGKQAYEKSAYVSLLVAWGPSFSRWQHTDCGTSDWHLQYQLISIVHNSQPSSHMTEASVSLTVLFFSFVRVSIWIFLPHSIEHYTLSKLSGKQTCVLWHLWNYVLMVFTSQIFKTN
jgi:hypothetical protein